MGAIVLPSQKHRQRGFIPDQLFFDDQPVPGQVELVIHMI